MKKVCKKKPRQLRLGIDARDSATKATKHAERIKAAMAEFENGGTKCVRKQ